MRAAAAILLVACCIPGPALAGGPPVSIILTPPRVYQRDATVSVRFLDPEAVPQQCRALGARSAAGTYALACTTGQTLVLPNPCAWPNRSDYQRIVCHELSHANGWPADHSDPAEVR